MTIAYLGGDIVNCLHSPIRWNFYQPLNHLRAQVWLGQGAGVPVASDSDCGGEGRIGMNRNLPPRKTRKFTCSILPNVPGAALTSASTIRFNPSAKPAGVGGSSPRSTYGFVSLFFTPASMPLPTTRTRFARFSP